MRSLKWSTSDAVWLSEVDDEHKEIFEAVAGLRRALSGAGSRADVGKRMGDLAAAMAGHFAHEERLMRAARYESLEWHRQLHRAARRKVREFALRMEQGDGGAGLELTAFLSTWLQNHTRVADRMMGSFLRNQRRVGKITFQAGTKPVDSCDWVNANGETFDPLAATGGF